MARKSKEEAFETREKILDSALEEMSVRSFSEVSLNKIAQKVGLSKGAIYWHFKSREDLLLNLLENLSLKVEKELETEKQKLNTLEEVKDFFESKFDKLAKSNRLKSMHRLMMRRYEWPEDIRERVRMLVLQKIEQERAMLEETFLRLQLTGEIRKDISSAELSAVVGAVFHGLFTSQLAELNLQDIPRHSAFIIEALLASKNTAQKLEKV